MSAFSSLQFQSKVALSTLETIANHQFGSKPLPIEQFELTANDIRINGDDGKLVVKATLEGAFSGKVNIKALPQYNSASKDIDFQDMELDLDGDDLKSKGIATFASGKILEQLQKFVKIPIKMMIDNLNTNIQSNEVQPGLLLQASIIDYQVQDINVTTESLAFQLNADVITTIKVQDQRQKA